MNNGACRCFFLNHVWCIRQIKLREGVKKLFMESVVFLTPSFQGKSSKNTVFLQSVQVSKISQNKLLTYFENLYGQPDSKKTIFYDFPYVAVEKNGNTKIMCMNFVGNKFEQKMCQISRSMSQITRCNCTDLIDSYSHSLNNSDIGINSLKYIWQTEKFWLREEC